MPNYHFFDKTNPKEVWDKEMTMNELDIYLELNPTFDTCPATPMIVAGRPSKPDNGFRDVLRTIKSKHRRSDINTF
jgi:hypothetical protein